MSTVVAKNVQVGTSGTATDNFTIRQPATPDGTVRIANGNSGTTTDLVTVTSAGNVGVGTSSPGQKLDVAGSGNTFGRVSSGNNATRAGWIATSKSSGGADVTMNLVAYGDSPEVGLYATTNHPLTFGNNNTERARIDSSGNLLVGTTSGSQKLRVQGGQTQDAAWFVTTHSVGSQYAAVSIQRSASTGDMIQFWNQAANTVIGTVSTNNTSVAYNTSSDYRLKHDIQPMTGALAKVAQLKPVTYKWNADNSDSQGFIAHELQEVVPQCVTGEKDAVDTDGKPVYQGIDTSFLVATLTAAIQEQQAIITALTDRITALESK